MKSLVEQVRDIFKETVSCKNCPYKNKDGYCTRIKDLFGVEIKTANDSTCICLDGFKIINKDEGGI